MADLQPLARARRPCAFPLAGGLLAGFLLAAPAWAQPSPEWIRVAVVRADPQVDLQIHGRFTIRALPTGQPIQQGRRLPAVAVRAIPQGLAFGAEVLPYA